MKKGHRLRTARVAAIVLLAAVFAACGSDDADITVYSGRSEAQVEPLLERFTDETGLKVSVRYGASAELAAQIAEEGPNSRADLFWSQDAGALGAVDRQGLLAPAPAEAAASVDQRFKAKDGTWVGITGRARVVVYNSAKVPAPELPATVFALTDPKWKGRVGIAPTNASFQAFVTAMRIQAGDGRTREWLQGLKANEPKVYESNDLIVRAANNGEVDLGLVNHYYLFQLGAEIGMDKLVARNHFTSGGDPGALINVAGVAILKSSDAQADAARLVQFLLSPPAQRHFAEENFEYPLLPGVPAVPALTPLDQIQSPNIDLSQLDRLAESLTLLREVGLL
ncbi:MAG: iron ABC transporter substrate-binding protein [Actinomycetota bacterium]|nr:iron ABC transporter substrate-binding protein [Actinomycetota bacterium]